MSQLTGKEHKEAKELITVENFFFLVATHLKRIIRHWLDCRVLVDLILIQLDC